MSNPYDPTTPPPPPGAPGGPGQPPPPSPFPAYPAPGAPGGPPGPGGPGSPGPWGPAPYSYPTPPSTDAVSITGFVLSLTFCLSVVGVVLGLVGLSRTRGGKRKGRWAAVSAIAVGAVLTVVAVLFTVLVAREVAAVVDPDSAEAGQCVDIDSTDDELTFSETDCFEAHDAEIVQVGRVGDQDPAGFTGPEQLCRAAMPDDAEARVDAFSTDLEWSTAAEDPATPEASDRYLCYVEPRSGDLDAPVLG